MPVTMTWNLAADCKPAHDEPIIWMQTVSANGAYGFMPREVCVEYQWAEFDETGDTGNAVCYEPGDEPLENHRLAILVDGYELRDHHLWMSIKDYDAFLEANIPALN